MIWPGFARSVVVCRPALPLDTPYILDFTRFIWEGHDYVPSVWEAWLANTDGLLAVAEYEGRAVGMARVVRLTRDQWWMEGFRVDPRYQGMKIGSHIHEYIDRWWLEHGNGTVRLMTSAKRVQVHHLCARLGYEKIGEVMALGAEAQMGEATFRSCDAAEIPLVLERLRSAPVAAQTHGLLDLGWKFVTPCEEVLRPLALQAGVLEWQGGEGYLVVWEESEDAALTLGLVACDWEALPELLRASSALAAASGLQRVAWLAPCHSEVLAQATKAGFVSLWENSGYLYQKVKA
jgi:GNAT superfamily N-acetyltransferase